MAESRVNEEGPSNFIDAIIRKDLEKGTYDGRVVTRFPPEPNGYLHIGHGKSICLNFGLAQTHGGVCHLRFDDTNPTTEDIEYVESIQNDVRWLGFDWGDNRFHASDYFEQLYEHAVGLIRKGLAYVDSQDVEAIRTGRGTVTEAGVESPYRNRSVEENLDLFARMKAGEFEDGTHVLRAKIDMTEDNMLLRDPLLYRIRHAHHYRTGDTWCIYPMYDYAHPLSDAIEGITHSLCTLEFENNRALYDWVVENTWSDPRPHQFEFARLNLGYTVMSKRKLLVLVNEGKVSGWDDPRLPTIAGLRRRGVPPSAIRRFCDEVGVAKANSRIDVGLLEYSIRDDLNSEAPRVMAVLDPLRVTITNYPDEQVEWLDAPSYPSELAKPGSRKVPFEKHLLLERADFDENPPRKFRRLSPGKEVRLRYGYFITCTDVVKDDAGNVVELLCTYDPATRGGDAPDGRKVQGTLHWVSANHSVPAEIRLYDRLFKTEQPDHPDSNFLDHLNPESLRTLLDARVEPSVVADSPGIRYQFERQGYFWKDPEDSTDRALVFNRIVTLKDTWSNRGQSTATSSAKQKRMSAATHVHRLPELNAEESSLAQRLETEFGLKKKVAYLLASRGEVAQLYLAALDADADPVKTANVLVNDLPSGEAGKIDGPALAEYVTLLSANRISSSKGKELIRLMADTGGKPEELMREHNLEQVSDQAELAEVIKKVIGAHPSEVLSYNGGKRNLIGFFIGAVMKATGGTANPGAAREMLTKALESEASI